MPAVKNSDEARFPATARTLDMFRLGYNGCYDRAVMGKTYVVDTHNHFRPFGGPAKFMTDVNRYMRDAGILFGNIYGIGQSLPTDSACEYYLDCVGTPARPSLKNDFANAQSYLDEDPEGTVLTLSMTFPDLARHETVVRNMDIMDDEFPGMFKWMGEVNLVKQALFGNHHSATPLDVIADWAPFMQRLRERNIPIAIHSDLGSDDNPEKYLPLMDRVLDLYPDNKIVWVHMGLSKELTTLNVDRHIVIMKRRLDEHPSLMLDISWRVIADNYFDTPERKAKYVAFFEAYSDRILTGTDFVASYTKNFNIYRNEVLVTGEILSALSDEAFRQIALGESYFRFLDIEYFAPQICK